MPTELPLIQNPEDKEKRQNGLIYQVNIIKIHYNC